MIKPILHQQQPDSFTCTSACLAMLTHTPVDTVISEFHEAYFRNEMKPIHYLTSKGLNVEALFTHCRTLPGELYLIVVPSLNKDAKLHNVILDLRDDDEFKVYDPNQDVEGRRWYVIWGQEIKSNYEVELSAYILEFIVHIEG